MDSSFALYTVLYYRIFMGAGYVESRKYPCLSAPDIEVPKRFREKRRRLMGGFGSGRPSGYPQAFRYRGHVDSSLVEIGGVSEVDLGKDETQRFFDAVMKNLAHLV